ncbi:hypothetical protein F5141DRAFT_1094678 [Pisolithus sp. B1]|nr:hypothetical protein F5141DRAFT_1094678 [Pisolithus sp. B1]
MLRLVIRLLFIQTYVYYMHHSEDTSVIKLTVAAIWLFDTLHVSFMCYTLYYYLVKSKRPLPVAVVLNRYR